MSSHLNIIKPVLIIFLAVILVGGCDSSNSNQQAFQISSELPTDIEGGAPNASFEEAALFAWRQFIALSWPAMSGTRDVPDNSELFGDTSVENPLVWETYRHKVEIYPGQGDNPPGFIDNPVLSFGYDSLPPFYIYGEGEVLPCEGQEVPSSPALVNLDELTQIGLNYMFAGASPSESDINNDPQLIRFLAKANKEHYEYVADPVTSYWSHSDAYNTAVENFKAVSGGNGTPSTLPGPVIDFPDGMVEIKAAFRELTNEELISGRYHVTTVRYYEQDDADPNSACYREEEWGLVGLHIIHKTPSAPTFIFATFEQADNLSDTNGSPVEDEDGNVINRFTDDNTTPLLFYEDGNPPMLNIIGETYCDDPGQRLYYQEVGPELFGVASGLPFEGLICQNYRDRDIPQTIVDANATAHEAISDYNNENGLEDSPWLYYKLVNVQWQPFDISEIDSENYDGNRSETIFFLNNIVIETDYTLQIFSGNIFFSNDLSGPPSNLPPNFDNFDAERTTYQNLLTFDDDGNLEKTYNMGGCQGCHGQAQLDGADFSFILKGGPVVDGPEATGVTTPGATNPAITP